MTDSPRQGILSVDNVHRVYGKAGRRATRQVHALKGVSFEVQAGEKFGIVGESGSGKSTLIRLLAALDHPTSGHVTFEGQQISGRKERDLKALRQKVQVVFQDPMSSLDPRMSVRAIVSEPLRGLGRREAESRVREVLDSVGIPAAAMERYPHQFSGGQRQRISIARALAPKPDLLIADEPVSALDVSVRAQILNLLEDLTRESGVTMVFVSHDLGVVRLVCDRVAVLNHGELVELGATEDVYANPQHDYTKALLAASPVLRFKPDNLMNVDSAVVASAGLSVEERGQ